MALPNSSAARTGNDPSRNCCFKTERRCLKLSSLPRRVWSLSAPAPPPPARLRRSGLPQQSPASARSLDVCVCVRAATLYCEEHTAHVLCMDVDDTLCSLNLCKQARCPAHHMTLSILLLLAHFIGDTHHTWCNQSTEYMK